MGVIEVTKLEGRFRWSESAAPVEAAAEEMPESAPSTVSPDVRGRLAWTAVAVVLEPRFLLVKGAAAGGRLV